MPLRFVATTLLACVFTAASSTARSGAVIVVNGDGTADFSTITAALGVAVHGDIILVKGGVDTESVVLGDTTVNIVDEDGEYPKVASMRVLS
ncbi:MAG: hypothetical protein ACI9EF_000122 [Pseudohongiellaceae bacterium]|jgi:hypothetical protein